MKFIRKILVRMLGLKGYLRLVSKTYIICISYGLMRQKYAELYYIKKLVRPGDHVLDIGANLGYYSFFMAVSTGKTGRLIAVEPIPLFAEVWKKNMKSLRNYNFTLFNCALGTGAREKVKMSIPVVDGVVRHGLTKVDDDPNATASSALSYEVPMKNGDALVNEAGMARLDFIKCDVEGFEQYVIPSLQQTLTTYHPTIQVELTGNDNRLAVYDFLVNLSYNAHILKDEKLVPVEKKDIFTFKQDFYFVHDSRSELKG